MKVLYTEEQRKEMVERLAREIVRDYGEEDIVLVVLLKGACWFAIHLSEAIERQRTKGDVYVEFPRFSSYGDEQVSSGTVEMRMGTQQPVTGKHVIIVDDVRQSGRTFLQARKYIELQKPADIKTCVMVEKVFIQPVEPIKLDYVGFKLDKDDPQREDLFLIGFGLDKMGAKRGVPFIYIED